MRFDSRSKIVVVIVMILLVACFVDASAQGQRRRRRVSRRITNPVIYSSPQPSPSPGATTDAQIVSEDEAGNQNIQPATQTTNSTHRRTNANQTEPDPDAMRRSVNRISSDVRALTQRMGQMEEQQRTLVNLERLSRSEQRAEALRTQLRDVLAKQDELHAREDQVSEALRPENIERATAGYGTTRPEEVREIRRHQLENEQHRIQDQLNTLEQSRVHLESAIASADAETERLRALVDASTTSTDQTGTNTGEQPVIVPAPNASPSPSPSTSPYAYPPLSF
ncbi:MAG TPA: hypothetical protein VK619_08585 [Pyrinomonadaceae bacterium]|nr:hypothetical protein [Pyrinomonadaceae bacterium]